jgi:hypothetical protein
VLEFISLHMEFRSRKNYLVARTVTA